MHYSTNDLLIRSFIESLASRGDLELWTGVRKKNYRTHRGVMDLWWSLEIGTVTLDRAILVIIDKFHKLLQILFVKLLIGRVFSDKTVSYL